MYLHLNRNTSVPAGEIVAIVNVPPSGSKAVCRGLSLPVTAVDGVPEPEWRCLVITQGRVFALAVTGKTILRRYQKCFCLPQEGAHVFKNV